MKKFLGMMIAIVMVLALVACGEKPTDNSALQQNTGSNQAEGNNSSVVTPAENNTSTAPAPAEGITNAKDGTLTLSKADLVVVVNGTSVPMPYKLKDLEAAGVPADESRDAIELGADDFFTANLYLDDNEDYLLIPSYHNGGDSAISITEAEAEEISMTTYADNPVDQGVSIFGVPFGMTKANLKALLGEPMLDEGNHFEWHLELPDMAYEGTLSVYVTGDSDDAGVSQINLSVLAK